MMQAHLPPPPPPRPIQIGRPSLHVVQDGAQDCSTCKNVSNCWQPKRRSTITPEEVVTNLLVCRLQRGIDRNKSVRLLLDLLRPKIRKMAVWVRNGTGAPLDDIITELESEAVATLLGTYVLGELVPPLVFLFNPRYGALRHWAIKTVKRAKRDRDHCLSYGSIGTEPAARHDTGVDLEHRLTLLNQTSTNNRVSSPPPTISVVPEEPERPAKDARVDQALSALSDGGTLSAVEYRVLRFCLTNARGNVRMTDWLHQRMARVIGIPRKDVSRIYGIACRKLIEAAGLRTKYLLERGITPPKRRKDRTRPLTADEVITALELLRSSRGKATILDVAWALGVTDVTLHQLRRRYGEMQPTTIREAMERR